MLRIIFCILLILPTYLVGQLSNEIIPIGKPPSIKKNHIAKTIHRAETTTDTYTCSQYYYNPSGYPECLCPSVMGFSVGYHDAIAAWFTMPISGRIDTLYWIVEPEIPLGADSTVYISFHRSNIYPGHGVNDASYPNPCLPWGYFSNPPSGISLFKEDASDTSWVSTARGLNPSFPPAGDDLGSGSVPVLFHAGRNAMALADNGITLNVTQGERILVSMERRQPTGIDGSPPTVPFLVVARATNDTNPTHFLKFYRTGSPSAIQCADSTNIEGWWLRGGSSDGFGPAIPVWSFSLTPSGHGPPIIDELPVDNPYFTFSQNPITVKANIYECNSGQIDSCAVASNVR